MKEEKQERQIIGVVVILLILLVLLGLSWWGAYRNYMEWRMYHRYFDNPGAPIESWMSLKTVEARYGIPQQVISDVIGMDVTRLNPHMSLDAYCKVYRKECGPIVEKLNALRIHA